MRTRAAFVFKWGHTPQSFGIRRLKASHVEEQTLEEIHDKVLNIPKPVADDGSCRKDELYLSLMKKLQPLWSHTEAIKALNRTFIQEDPDCTLDHKIVSTQ